MSGVDRGRGLCLERPGQWSLGPVRSGPWVRVRVERWEGAVRARLAGQPGAAGRDRGPTAAPACGTLSAPCPCLEILPSVHTALGPSPFGAGPKM